MFKSLDHIAIVVADTDQALELYQTKLGLPLLFSEVLAEQNVRLTHLDLGNSQLQLLQPLTDDHPLQAFLQDRGEGLHHICLEVEDVPEAMAAMPERGLAPADPAPRRGPLGRQAAFIDPQSTGGILFEITNH